MATPGTSNKIISDLVPDVIDALQQRTDVSSIAPRYIRRALQEITESNVFEELRVPSGPLVTLTIGQASYPVSAFLNSGDDLTSVEALTIYVDPPNNTTSFALNYRTPKAIQMMIAPTTQGTPGWWTRFGNAFQFGPVPNQNFTVYMMYQRRHPFPDDINALATAPIFIPDSWEEIVVYSAALRIAIIKRWNDQADTLHKTLYGDPASGVGADGKLARPGLIAARVFQFERDAKFNSRSLGIIQGRYTR